MGGFGSGNRHQGGKLTVGACLQLDADTLKRQGLFSSGTKATIKWHDGFTVKAQYADDWLTLTHSDGKSQHSYKLGAYRRAQHLGGYRWVFCCPNQSCVRPCKRLYLRRGYFLCRKCQRLGYISQQISKADQPHYAYNKLRKSLGWSAGLINGIEGKPPNIHWATYSQQLRKHEQLEAKAYRQMYEFTQKLKAHSNGLLEQAKQTQEKANRLLSENSQ